MKNVTWTPAKLKELKYGDVFSQDSPINNTNPPVYMVCVEQPEPKTGLVWCQRIESSISEYSTTFPATRQVWKRTITDKQVNIPNRPAKIIWTSLTLETNNASITEAQFRAWLKFRLAECELGVIEMGDVVEYSETMIDKVMENRERAAKNE